jgi:hypothetical protein
MLVDQVTTTYDEVADGPGNYNNYIFLGIIAGMLTVDQHAALS